MSEREEKRARVRALLEGDGDGIALRDPANLAWYLDGARVHVVGGISDAICEVTVTARGRGASHHGDRGPADGRGGARPRRPAAARTAVVGAARARRAGERPAAPAASATSPRGSWPRAPRCSRRRSSACARSPAGPPPPTGAALRAAGSGESEFTLAGRAARELLDREIEPVVLLAAGEERLPRHRHPLPTAAPLGARAMLVVCGRRHGLICSVTRMRAWTPLRAAERETYDGLLAVEAVALDATRPGARIGDVVAAVAAAYPANGFAADEWHQHHQGGPTGYAPRDYLASPAADALVADPQAFAWNPSGGGFKVEDTVLATAAGIEVLSPDPDWPSVEVGGRSRPDVLT